MEKALAVVWAMACGGALRLLVTGIVLGLVACASQAPQSPVADDEAPPVAVEAGPVVRPAPQDYAQRASDAMARGDLPTAIALAERGLRVNRYQAELYWVLAQAYSLQGLQVQAANFARLGLRYVGDNASLADKLRPLAGDE